MLPLVHVRLLLSCVQAMCMQSKKACLDRVPNCGSKIDICASVLLYSVDVLEGSCIH